MRKRGMGFHGKGRMGSNSNVTLGSAEHMGGQGARVFKANPAGFNAESPAPKFPGTGGITMPGGVGPHAPTMPGISRRR